MFHSLWPHGLQHTRLPCPLFPPGVCSNSCPLSWWCLYLLKSYRFFSRLGKGAILSHFFSCKLSMPPLNPYSSNMLISFFLFLSHSLTSERPVYLFASLSLLDLRDRDDTNNCRNNQHHSELLPQSSSAQSLWFLHLSNPLGTVSLVSWDWVTCSRPACSKRWN